MALYRENKVRKIILKSFEDDGSESEGFFCEKKLSKDYRKAEFFTRANISAPSLFRSFFDTDGKLLRTKDSSQFSVSDITYKYDEKRRISSIISNINSRDYDYVNSISEQHNYS